jgi:hypothetical protein
MIAPGVTMEISGFDLPNKAEGLDDTQGNE